MLAEHWEATVSTYTRLVRPLLFRMHPERAQWLAEKSLIAGPLWRAVSNLDDTRLHSEVAGIQLPNPIGLAAGWDKDCSYLERLGNLGFGYVVGGTVLPKCYDGNDFPRIVRNPSEGSLVNSMGFPTSGVEEAARNLSRTEGNGPPRLVSIAGYSVDEYVECYHLLSSLSGGVEVNISCPNTDDPRFFQNPTRLGELLAALEAEKTGPLFVKLPPYIGDNERVDVMNLVNVCLDHGVEGVTVSNTHPVEDERLAVGRGGLSGRPLLPHTLRMVADIRNHAGTGFAINGCGGISSGEDVLSVLRAGADSVQLFTGFVYGGRG